MTKQSAVILQVTLMLLLQRIDAKIEIITRKQEVHVGEETLLLCKAGGEGEITWRKDSEDIDDEERVSKVDETSSTLVIKKATMQDAGKYVCVCIFDSGHTDEVATQLFVYEGPSFGSTQIHHEFLEGTRGVMPCLVTGQPAVDVHWLKDKKDISSDAGQRVRRLPDRTVVFDPVKREDAGTYECQARIRGRDIEKLLRVSVVVNAPPFVHLREEEKKVMADTKVSLLCLVDGHPKPNITWLMPVAFDPSHHQFNSDRSELTMMSVTRADYGEYVCTATNKIAESSATIMLHVYEAPEVFVSAEQQSVAVGQRVSVSCNVSGHPQPELHWLNKHSGRTLNSTSFPVHVVDDALVIDEVIPSDGGMYSCMAVSIAGNASRDVTIHTQPGPPNYLSVSPGPSSVLFSLKTPPISGGTPITSFVLQWRQSATEQWKEITVPASAPLAITPLKPYTMYTVRLAALNAVGVGKFSDGKNIRTQAFRGEPDSPVVLSNEMKVEGNSFSVPLKQSDDGGTPMLHFDVRYRQDKEGTEWKEMQLPSNADSVSLQELSYGSDYKLEVVSVNRNGSSIPATFNFTIADQPVSSMTKGNVVAIVMVIFLVVFLVIDATCCYRNHCGLLMSIAVKIFGQKVPGLQMLEVGEGTNGEVKMKGISTPRGSVQHSDAKEQTLANDGGRLTEITCDKAPLTKHEKKTAGRGTHTANA
ncbi:neural cell adhesion molecule 1 isoform X1 [Gasterosteus aculeatus]